MKNDKNFTPLAYGSQSLLSFLNLDKGVIVSENSQGIHRFIGTNDKMFSKREEDKPHVSEPMLLGKANKKSMDAFSSQERSSSNRNNILEAYLAKK